MPISKAAKKAQRQNIKRKAHNVQIKKELKESIKKAAAKNLSQVFSTIDKAAKRHIIHKNKAARLKSQLAKKFSGKIDEDKEKSKLALAKPNAKKITKKQPPKIKSNKVVK